MLEKALHSTPLMRAPQKLCKLEAPGRWETGKWQFRSGHELRYSSCWESGRAGGGWEAVRGPVCQGGLMQTGMST